MVHAYGQLFVLSRLSVNLSHLSSTVLLEAVCICWTGMPQK
jgi:hypothetical protein